MLSCTRTFCDFDFVDTCYSTCLLFCCCWLIVLVVLCSRTPVESCLLWFLICGKLFVVMMHTCCKLWLRTPVELCVATMRCVDYRHVHLWRSVLAVVAQSCGKLFRTLLWTGLSFSFITHVKCILTTTVIDMFLKLSVPHKGSGSFQQ